MGCGIFPSLALAPALATGSASKQEERKYPIRLLSISGPQFPGL